MTATGHGACWMQCWPTEPSSSPLNPPRPLDPTTSSSAASAARSSALAAWSSTRTGRTSKGACSCGASEVERVIDDLPAPRFERGGILEHVGRHQRVRRHPGVDDVESGVASRRFGSGPVQRARSEAGEPSTPTTIRDCFSFTPSACARGVHRATGEGPILGLYLAPSRSVWTGDGPGWVVWRRRRAEGLSHVRSAARMMSA